MYMGLWVASDADADSDSDTALTGAGSDAFANAVAALGLGERFVEDLIQRRGAVVLEAEMAAPATVLMYNHGVHFAVDTAEEEKSAVEYYYSRMQQDLVCYLRWLVVETAPEDLADNAAAADSLGVLGMALTELPADRSMNMDTLAASWFFASLRHFAANAHNLMMYSKELFHVVGKVAEGLHNYCTGFADDYNYLLEAHSCCSSFPLRLDD